MLRNKYMLGLLKTTAVTALGLAVSLPAMAVDISKLPVVTQEMVAPPFLPKHDQVSKGQKLVKVTLSTIEKPMVLDADGTTYQAMTFNGTLPGPAIVVHQDDYVELTLTNPKTSTLEHNIDLHEVTGALGGAGLTKVKPGESKTIRFKATKLGTFVYHCAPGGMMIPYHIISGMHGLIMVLPKDGLKDKNGKSLTYNKAWYFGENEWYAPKDKNGKYMKYDSPMEAMNDVMEVAKGLIPTHVTLGGKAFAYTGDNALKANVGDTVLMVHSQSNRDSRPHLIGGHGEYVWERGNFADAPITDIETWFIAGGSA
ncbi:MAG: nitrite reductase, copper-containing, partial [Gammaproteobacteria bacterium RBG_16_57_12]